MAIVTGINSGFVSEAPVVDPAAPTHGKIDNNAWAAKAVSPVGAAKITEIGWYCDETPAGVVNFEVGLYDHNAGTDEPSDRLYVDTTNTFSGTVGWQTATVDWAIDAETTYWIGVSLDNTGDAYIGAGPASGASRFALRIGTPFMNDPFASGSEDVNALALYAVHGASNIEEGTKTVTAAAVVSLATELVVRTEGTKTVSVAAAGSLASENYVSQKGFPTPRPSDLDPDLYWDEDSGTWGSTRTTYPGNWDQNIVTVSEEGEIYFGSV